MILQTNTNQPYREMFVKCVKSNDNYSFSYKELFNTYFCTVKILSYEKKTSVITSNYYDFC